MGTLLMVGNGFDVDCGMKTRYRDMYPGYIKSPSSSSIIQQFKDSISSDIDNWGDFEMAMAEYAGILNNEDDFLECLRDFNIYLEKYLIEEQIAFKKTIEDERIKKAIRVKIYQSLSGFYDGMTHNLSDIMNDRGAGKIQNMSAISFNYTDVFDLLYSDCKSRYSSLTNVVHIHGKLNDGPFLGVDNVSQVNTNYVFSKKAERSFIKPISNRVYDIHRVDEAKELIHYADTICVFGMSLGDSDLSWRNELLNWVKERADNHLFIFKHSMSRQTYRTVMEKLDKEDDARDRIVSGWNAQLDESELERIHIPCGVQLFGIDEVIKEQVRINEQANALSKTIDEIKDVKISDI